MTRTDEYQIFAFEPTGDLAWALRVAGPRHPLSREEIDGAMGRILERFPGAAEGAVDWPEHEPALGKLWVDGHGHLYVFHYRTPAFEPAERRVDVYSPNGERLFAGLFSPKILLWAERFVTHGDYVYDIRRDAETGEEHVVRYRLVEPFD